MKASLLGCGEEKQGGGRGGELGATEEKCLYEYNPTMGRWGLTNTLHENIEVFAVCANKAF